MIARFEQRLIEGGSVIGDQDLKIFQMTREGIEETCFLAIAAHEELADSESFFGDAADAD